RCGTARPRKRRAAARRSWASPQEVPQALHQFSDAGEGIAGIPDLEPGAGRLPADELLEALPGARVTPGEPGGRAAEDMQEPLHVAPQPAYRYAHIVPVEGLHRFAAEHPHPEHGEVHTGADRELERAPKPPVYLHEPGWVITVVAELDHGRSMPFEVGDEPLDPLAEPGVRVHRATQAAPRSRGPDFPEPLVGDERNDAAVVTDHGYARAPSVDKGLNERPVRPLAARLDGCSQMVGPAHVDRTEIRRERGTVPGIGEPRLDDARVTE